MEVQSVVVTPVDTRSVQVQVAGLLAGADSSRYQTTYTVLGNGVIHVHSSFAPGYGELPRMPRFGMRMEMPNEFQHLQWYGRGPHESYWDRKAGARVGLFGGLVSEQYHPYIRPQESGNKTDIRWMSLRNDRGIGLLVVGDPLLSGSALHYTQEDLDDGEEKDQRHSGELRELDLVALNIDFKQMGVGGINSWGPTALPDYSLPYRAYGYSFTLKPYSSSDGRPWELARIQYSR